MSVIRQGLGKAALLLPIVSTLLDGGVAAAETAAVAPPQRVEVAGTLAADDGRDSTASRMVVNRDELARHGDNSVVDVLRRVPGITVLGGQGRATDIRMHGLGSGYTQVLINGEAVPGGFSLESISPAQIERIEIARVATVDLDAQAIAGTINVVLRQAMRKAQRELKAVVGSRSGRATLQLDGQFSDRLEGASYSVGTGFSRKSEAWPSDMVQEGFGASGAPELQRLTRRRAHGIADSISLTPKLAPQWGEKDKLSVEALLRHNRFDDHSDDQRTTTLGPLPRYSSDTQGLRLVTTLVQARVNWTHAFDNGGTAEARLGTNHLRRDSDTHFEGQDERGILAMNERVSSATTERGLSGSGKFRLAYRAGHAVAIGWDGERSQRDEARSQRQSSPIGRTVVDLDEAFRTSVDRLAVYAQDEWDWDDTLSAYAGVRWASLRTRTDGQGLEAVGHRSAVLSPVLQVLWKPPGLPGDQLRFALSRTYKSPRAVDLTPRRFVAVDNTATTPNLQGNPNLRPELAWGIDLAFEHALPRKAGSINVSAMARRIRDVTLDQLTLDQGAWVSSKANAGSARVLGLEVESRLNLRAAWPAAADMDLRASLSRNWSSVEQVPGPDNRLDSQIPLSAHLGLDWRLARLPVTAGASLAYRGALRARSSLTQTTAARALSTLDLYVLWKITPQAQWRLALGNALGQHDVTTDTHSDAAGRFRQITDEPSAPTWRLGIELTL